jgi:hypothetical protein
MINSMTWHVSLAMLPSSTIPSSNNTKKNLLGWQAEMDVDAGPQSPLYLLKYAACGMWLLSLQAGPLAASGAHYWYMTSYVMLCLIRQRDASKHRHRNACVVTYKHKLASVASAISSTGVPAANNPLQQAASRDYVSGTHTVG